MPIPRSLPLGLAAVLAWTGAADAQLTRIRTFAGGTNEGHLGEAVALIRDLNDDGVDEVLAAEPAGNVGEGVGRAGNVLVRSGATNEILATLSGETDGDGFGAAVASVPDVDGDGLTDIAVGAPGWDLSGDPPLSNAGRVYVYSSSDFALLYTLDGDQALAGYGRALAGVGDLDGDGRGDLVVGAPTYDGVGLNTGLMEWRSGADGSLIEAFEGAFDQEQLGAAVASAGRFDADAVHDVLVSAPGRNIPPVLFGAGAVDVRSGATGEVLATFESTAAGGRFGDAIAAAGDVDGRGTVDVVVGAPQEGAGDVGAGYLIAGEDGAVLDMQVGPGPGARMGDAVAGGVDVDGDVIPDYVFAVPSADPPFVRIYSGATFAQIQELGPDTETARFGTAVAISRGGIGGDQLMLIGSPDFDARPLMPLNNEQGRVYVLGAPRADVCPVPETVPTIDAELGSIVNATGTDTTPGEIVLCLRGLAGLL